MLSRDVQGRFPAVHRPRSLIWPADHINCKVRDRAQEEKMMRWLRCRQSLSKIKINQKKLCSGNGNYIGRDHCILKKHAGLDFHKCCSFVHVFSYQPSIFHNDFYFDVTYCIAFQEQVSFFACTQTSSLILKCQNPALPLLCHVLSACVIAVCKTSVYF